MKQRSIDNINAYMSKTHFTMRDEKIKEFKRFKNIDNYFRFDTEKDIEKTRNIWAGYAYELLEEKISKGVLPQKEEEFIKSYFEDYLLETTQNKFEEQVKSFYLKYRMSKDFEYNKIVNKDTDSKSEAYKKGLEEFKKTINLLLLEMNVTDINLLIDGNEENRYIKEADVSLAYLSYIQKDYDSRYILDLVKKVSFSIESAKLREIKSNEVSSRAVVYTIEDYLESKTRMKNKMGKLYNDLYKSLIANKQLAIDSFRASYNELSKLRNNLMKSTYRNIDKVLKKYSKDYKAEIMNMKHYNNDLADYSKDNTMSTIYRLYINALKAMPKSRLTAVTKYFAVNGEPLSVIEMNMIIEGYRAKYKKETDEAKKKKIEEKLNEINDVISFVKLQSYIYSIEEVLINENNPLNPMVIELISEHYGDYQDMKYKLTRLYENLDNLASSGSATKVSTVLLKKRKVLEILNKCKLIDEYIKENEALSKKLSSVENDSDIVISNIRNYNKAIALLQELTGKGIVTCKGLIDESLKTGTPVIRGLDKNLNKFICDILFNSGVARTRK